MRAPLGQLVQKYTRKYTQPTGSDLKTYDLGSLHVATVAPAETLGELHVSYTVELFKPQSSRFFEGQTFRATAGMDYATLFGTNTVGYSEGDENIWVQSDAATMKCGEAGNYSIVCIIKGATLATVFGIDPTGTNPITLTDVHTITNSASTEALGFFQVICTVGGQDFTPQLNTSGTVTQCHWLFVKNKDAHPSP